MPTLTITRHGNMFGYTLSFDKFLIEQDINMVNQCISKANEVHQVNVDMIMERMRNLKIRQSYPKKKEKGVNSIISNNNSEG